MLSRRLSGRAALAVGLHAWSLAGAAPAQCTNQWLPGDRMLGVAGSVNAIAAFDPDGPGPLGERLVVGGSFAVAGGVLANNIAVFDPATSSWSALGAGTNTSVRAVIVRPNGDIVAGGMFSTAGGIGASGIAIWNGAAWQPIGQGTNALSGWVYALTNLPNGQFAAGGDFSFTPPGGFVGRRIARWDGTAWQHYGTGTVGLANNEVFALAALPNGNLVAGGSFVSAGGFNTTFIALWNGTNWQPMGASAPNGVNGHVLALTALQNGHVVAAGNFSMAGTTPLARIGYWNGSAWSSLGAGFDTPVNAVAIGATGEIVAGGTFSASGTTALSRIARWNGASWAGYGNGATGPVLGLATLSNGDVYAGGTFVTPVGVASRGIARWSGSTWQPLGTGTDHCIGAIAVTAGGGLVAGGSFTSIGGNTAARIASWNGVSWSPLGSGFDQTVHCTLALATGEVVAGGAFTAAGATTVNAIARWIGGAWQPLGSGMGLGGIVRALAQLPNGLIVAGGSFASAGGVAAANVAAWNGSSWSPMGAGLDATVHSLATGPNGELYAGGGFGLTGATNVSRVARWNGSAWQPLGTAGQNGVNNTVHALAVRPDGSVVAGGLFTTAGGGTAYRVATWNGAAWQPMGTGLSYFVYALAVLPNGEVLAGGDAGGAPSRVSRWNGSAWLPIGAGIDAGVNALTVRANGEVVAGGCFAAVPGAVSAAFARLAPGCPAAVTTLATACIGPAGPLVLTTQGLPWVGTTFASSASGYAANAVGVSVMGFSSPGTPLSSLLASASPTCHLLAAPDAVVLLVPIGGTASVQFGIPNDAALAGVQLFQQHLQATLDAQGTLSSLSGSNGLAMMVGAL